MKDLSLYIHIPFCKTICLYCNFLTFAHKNKFIAIYIDSLQQEIITKAKNLTKYRIETIYFGGGTPSLIESRHIESILKTIRENFHIKESPEINIECNPESIDLKKLQHYQKIGVTRISLGIQSFDKKTLHRLARPHDEVAIFKALAAIKESGFKNYGADFIMGLPYQTVNNFKAQLKQILEFQFPHLSFYFLSYDTKRIDIFKADCPSEEKQVAMYEHLTKTLRKAGYLHYEVSNYAKPGFECQHNLRYWNQQEYLGLGIGAHSYISGICIENELNFDEYLKHPEQIHEKVEIDQELQKMDYIMLQLRTSTGIKQKNYQKRFNDYENLLNKAKPLLDSGHLVQNPEGFSPTEKGFLILDKITKDLI